MTFDPSFVSLYARRAHLVPSTPEEPEPGEQVIDFTLGHPDPRFFPVKNLQAAIATVLATSASDALQYSNFRGSKALLEVLVPRLAQQLNTHLDFQNLIITNGSMQVLGLMAQVFIDPGDRVLTEAPTYFRAVTIFRNYEAEIDDIPIDQFGLRLELLENTLRRRAQSGRTPKFLYTIPTHQNPSGTTLTLERRQKLLELSSRYGFMILEDTAYNELWYDEKPPPSLFELDAGVGRVIQMGTFSKIIAPGLAVGWALGPEPVITRFVEFKVNGGTTPLTSHIAAAFLVDELFEQHVASLRLIYKEKRDAMIEALEEYMQGFVTWYRPGGGYFVWLQLRDDVNLDVLWENAVSEGVIYLPGRFCFANAQNQCSMIRLAFSALSPEDIREGVRRLSIAVQRSYEG